MRWSLPQAGGKPTQIAYSSGDPWRLQWCDWATNERLICKLYGINNSQGPKGSFTRLMAFDRNGENVIELGEQSRVEQAYAWQFDGQIISWDAGENGAEVLMARYYHGLPDSNARIDMLQKSDAFLREHLGL